MKQNEIKNIMENILIECFFKDPNYDHYDCDVLNPKYDRNWAKMSDMMDQLFDTDHGDWYLYAPDDVRWWENAWHKYSTGAYKGPKNGLHKQMAVQ